MCSFPLVSENMIFSWTSDSNQYISYLQISLCIKINITLLESDHIIKSAVSFCKCHFIALKWLMMTKGC